MSRTWLQDRSVVPTVRRASLEGVQRAKKPLLTTGKEQASLVPMGQLPVETTAPKKRRTIRKGMYVALVSGLALMALLITGCSTYVLPIGQAVLTRWSVGQDKIASYRLDVGHNGPSHFLTEYYQGQAVVIEFVGGDAKKARVYVLSVASPHDHVKRLVTLYLATIPQPTIGGKPHLLVHIEGLDGKGMYTARVLYNTGESFSDQPTKGKNR